jgi:hypothetical protein
MRQIRERLMVASVWRLVIPEDELSRFLRDCEINILPHYKIARGLLFVWLWHRPCVAYADVQIVALWHSLQDMNEFTHQHPLEMMKYKQESVIVPEGAATSYEVVVWIASTGTESR